MSEEDYINVENELFAETGDNENRDYYEEEANEYTIPDPKEAIAEPELDIDDDEENTMEMFSPKRITKSESKVLVYTNIFKESAESEDLFKTRVYLASEIIKKKIMLTEQAELYARIIANKLWYNMHYTNEIEKNVEEILQAL